MSISIAVRWKSGDPPRPAVIAGADRLIEASPAPAQDTEARDAASRPDRTWGARALDAMTWLAPDEPREEDEWARHRFAEALLGRPPRRAAGRRGADRSV